MINKKTKDLWIEALRSGDYEQGREALCRVDSSGNARYCCLGVLAEVVEGEDAWEVPADPYRVCGLSIKWNGHRLLFSMSHLGKMNDNGKSFKQIALYIENHVSTED